MNDSQSSELVSLSKNDKHVQLKYDGIIIYPVRLIKGKNLKATLYRCF